uniref:Uncharacterized protein n=1 Tax=Sipha flava TaxID=143950 RepID=A0A2S2QQH7_9HEMI
MPKSSPAHEISFSTLERIKKTLKSTLSDSYLEYFMLMAVEKKSEFMSTQKQPLIRRKVRYSIKNSRINIIVSLCNLCGKFYLNEYIILQFLRSYTVVWLHGGGGG